MMTHREALEVLAGVRDDRIVFATMGSVGIWPSLSDTPLDFSYLPSSMGQGIPLALGLTLGCGKGTIVLCGDGSLMMNLGCLATVANHPAPIAIVLIDNGLYEVTGGQQIVGAGTTDFAPLAKAVGIKRVFSFGNFEEWQEKAASAVIANEPTFIWLKIKGERGRKTPLPPRPMHEQLSRLRSALGVTP